VTATGTSCPRCGAGAAAHASRCDECGFAFFEEPSRRSLPRLSPRWILIAVVVLAVTAAGLVLLRRDSAPEALDPVAAARAEPRLESRLRRDGIEEIGAVRCAGSVERARATRCQLLYDNGDTQLMLVRLTSEGRLDIEVPYPAQRRPGG
jgi:hypothetical protein